MNKITFLIFAFLFLLFYQFNEALGATSTDHLDVGTQAAEAKLNIDIENELLMELSQGTEDQVICLIPNACVDKRKPILSKDFSIKLVYNKGS